jgi:two-component system, LuxR family, response regulator FixJ
LPSEAATVYIVDDDAAFREAVKTLLLEEGFHTETYETANHFVSLNNWSGAGCLLLDMRMPEMNGLEVQAKLDTTDFALPIIFLTGHGNVPTAVQALKMGAYDFIEKPFQNDNLVEIVRSAIELSKSSTDKKAEENTLPVADLTKRENDVFNCLVRGLTNKATAAELELSQRTIEFHRSNIMQKLEASSVAELIFKSQRR